MGIGKTLKRVAAYGFKRKNVKNLRAKLGLTAKSKLFRQLKRLKQSFKAGNVVSSTMPTSAGDVGYRYDSSRSLSRLTGGV